MSFIFGSLLVVGVIVYAVAAFMYFLISSSHLVRYYRYTRSESYFRFLLSDDAGALIWWYPLFAPVHWGCSAIFAVSAWVIDRKKKS